MIQGYNKPGKELTALITVTFNLRWMNETVTPCPDGFGEGPPKAWLGVGPYGSFEFLKVCLPPSACGLHVLITRVVGLSTAPPLPLLHG